MSLPSDTPQGIADALGYLQHHLQELTERQHVSENNINSTLAALTMQLQQLTQLVANPPPLAVPNTPPPPVLSPPVSPPPAPPVRRTHPKLSCPLDFNGECHNGHAFLNSCSLYIHLAPEQFHDEQERVVPPSGPKTYSVKKRTLAFSPSKPGENLNNNSGCTSSLQTRKRTRSTPWKELPTTKEIGR